MNIRATLLLSVLNFVWCFATVDTLYGPLELPGRFHSSSYIYPLMDSSRIYFFLSDSSQTYLQMLDSSGNLEQVADLNSANNQYNDFFRLNPKGDFLWQDFYQTSPTSIHNTYKHRAGSPAHLVFSATNLQQFHSDIWSGWSNTNTHLYYNKESYEESSVLINGITQYDNHTDLISVNIATGEKNHVARKTTGWQSGQFRYGVIHRFYIGTNSHLLFYTTNFDESNSDCEQRLFSTNGISVTELDRRDCGDDVRFIYPGSHNDESIVLNEAKDCMYFGRLIITNPGANQKADYDLMEYCEDGGLRKVLTIPGAGGLAKGSILNNKLFFNTRIENEWKSVAVDLTSSALSVISDILFSEVIPWENGIMFLGKHPSATYDDLYLTDGSAGDIRRVPHDNPRWGACNRPSNLALLNGMAYFSNNGVYREWDPGKGVCVSNGTAEGTYRLKVPELYPFSLENIFGFGNELILFGYPVTTGTANPYIVKYTPTPIIRLFSGNSLLEMGRSHSIGTVDLSSINNFLLDTISVWNIGSANLHLKNTLLVEGDHSDAFSLLSISSLVIKPGDSALVVIRWMPDSVGEQYSTLHLLQENGDSLSWNVSGVAEVPVPSSVTYNLTTGKIYGTNPWLEYSFSIGGEGFNTWIQCTSDSTELEFPSTSFQLALRVVESHFPSRVVLMLNQAFGPSLAINYENESLYDTTTSLAEYSWTADFSDSFIGTGDSLPLHPGDEPKTLYARYLGDSLTLVSTISQLLVPARANHGTIEVDYENERSMRVFSQYEYIYTNDPENFIEPIDNTKVWATDGLDFFPFLPGEKWYFKKLILSGFSPDMDYLSIELPERPEAPILSMNFDNISPVQGYEDVLLYECSSDSALTWVSCGGFSHDASGLEQFAVRIAASNLNKNFSGEIAYGSEVVTGTTSMDSRLQISTARTVQIYSLKGKLITQIYVDGFTSLTDQVRHRMNNLRLDAGVYIIRMVSGNGSVKYSTIIH